VEKGSYKTLYSAKTVGYEYYGIWQDEFGDLRWCTHKTEDEHWSYFSKFQGKLWHFGRALTEEEIVALSFLLDE
jgi:hypothetical protein